MYLICLCQGISYGDDFSVSYIQLCLTARENIFSSEETLQKILYIDNQYHHDSVFRNPTKYKIFIEKSEGRTDLRSWIIACIYDGVRLENERVDAAAAVLYFGVRGLGLDNERVDAAAAV